MFRFMVAFFCLAVVTAEPNFCRTRLTPYACLANLFTSDIITSLMSLRQLNLIELTRTDMELEKKLDAIDAFCGPFQASVTCTNSVGKVAGRWWECSMDVAAVASMINAIFDSESESDSAISESDVSKYLNYASEACGTTAGLRDLLEQKECFAKAFEESSDTFKNEQLESLSSIYSANSFAGHCEKAQNGIFELMEVVERDCPSHLADSVFKFSSATFVLVPGYNASECPINRTRPDSYDSSEGSDESLESAETTEEPSWCQPHTSASKYMCFSRAINADIIKRVYGLRFINPTMLTSLATDADVDSKLAEIDHLCEFVNTTEECAGKWWKCEADANSVAILANDLQVALSEDGEVFELQGEWIRRYFGFTEYLCSRDDIRTVQANQECIRTAFTGEEESIKRIENLITGVVPFETIQQCNDLGNDLATIIETVRESCPEAAEAVGELFNQALQLLNEFTVPACGWISEREGVHLRRETTEVAPVTTTAEPSWCQPRTSASKYMCFSRAIDSDVIKSVYGLRYANPTMLASLLTEADVASKLAEIDQLCEFVNTTEECAGKWWHCEADSNSVATLVNDLQVALSDDGKVFELQGEWIQRYFHFTEYLCSSDDIWTVQFQRECIRTAFTGQEEPIQRIRKWISMEQPFNVEQDCPTLSEDIAAIVDTVAEACEEDIDESIHNLLQQSLRLIDGYTADACRYAAEMQ